MSHLFAYWLHHSNNFPTGLYFLGVPLFVINRLGKVCLLFSALVILLDIIGQPRLEAYFQKLHERVAHFISKHHLKNVVQELSNNVSVFVALFKTTFRKDSTEIDQAARKKVGPVFRVMGIGILAWYAISVLLAAIMGLSTFLSLAGHDPLYLRLYYGMIVFVLSAGLLCFLFTLAAFIVSLVLWVLALLLRPIEIVLKAVTGFIMRKVNDKGAAHSWRMASLTLLLVGFFLDFCTS